MAPDIAGWSGEGQTMPGVTTSGQTYLGSARILRPRRSRVAGGGECHGDPAAAQADAGQMTDARGGIRHKCDVGHEGEGLVVLGDVLVTGGLASAASGIVDTWRT